MRVTFQCAARMAIIASAIILSGCAVNAVTGERELRLLGESWELRTGREQYGFAQQIEGGQYSADPHLTPYIAQVGARVAKHAERDLPYEFVVLNNDTPNAWALPGGKIAINRGLLTELASEAELAAVLSHEVVHAAARHGAKGAQRGLLLQATLLATGIALSDKNYGAYVLGGALLGAQLIGQRYSREAEREADYHGMRYMIAAGYDPTGAVGLQEKFVALSEGRKQNWLGGLFASHPPSPERVQNARATIAELEAELGATGGDSGRARYQKALAHAKSKQPAYKMAAEAVRLANDSKSAEAFAKVNAALALEPAEAAFYGLKGDLLRASGRHNEAVQQYNSALARQQNYFRYYLGRGVAHNRLGRRAEAKRDLQASNRLLPTAVAESELGKLSLASGDTDAALRHLQSAASAPGATRDEALSLLQEINVAAKHPHYFRVQILRTEAGELAASVKNVAPISFYNVQIEFTTHGRRVATATLPGELRPGQARDIGSGGLVDADKLSTFRARVVDVGFR